MLPKTCQKPSVVCVLHVTNRCFRCLFVLDSRAESRSCKKCHLVVITVEVEMPSQADSAGLALRSSGCFQNEARNLPVTSYWQSCLKPRGIFCGCILNFIFHQDNLRHQTATSMPCGMSTKHWQCAWCH